MPTTTELDWTTLLLEQFTQHWDDQARRRLDGLTDEEYLWEPVPGAWNLRRRGEEITSMAAGGGDWVADFEYPDPTPAPVTTIAWRIAHLLVGVFGTRNASHFGGPPTDYFSRVWQPNAGPALAELDAEVARWRAGVAALGGDGLAQAVGPAEGPWAEAPYATLVLHIHREAIHHLGEIALLRDLYAHRG